MKKLIASLLFIISLLVRAVHAQTGNIGSRIYFPELYGLSTSLSTDNSRINSGLLFSSAVEYRFDHSNWFARFNYDELNNKYTTNFTSYYSDIISGKIANDFLLMGAGYRIKQKKIAYYAVFQPGLAISGYNTAVQTNRGIILLDKSATNPSLKLGLGTEYYLFNGFAIDAETAYYNVFGTKAIYYTGFHNLSFSFGITTTLF